MKKNFVLMLTLLMVASLLFSSSALALTDAKLKAPKVAKGPAIDGKLDDEAWTKATPVVLENTNKGVKAKVKSEAWVVWDDENIYMAFKTQRAKKFITTGAKADGGSVWSDDSHEMFFDPTLGKSGGYAQFIVNAIGVKYNGSKLPGVPAPKYTDWKAAAVQENDYWTLEVAIPFSALKQKTPTPGTKWGFNLCGNTTGFDRESISWSPIRGSSFLVPNDFGEIEFVN